MMELPVQIDFRGMASSPAVERRIHEKVEKLKKFHDRLTSCRVVVESRSRKQGAGQVFHVRVDVTAPGYEIVAGNAGLPDRAHEDVYVALRDAFAAATRQLEERVRIARGEVKSHQA